MPKATILDASTRGRCPGCLNGNFWECWSFAGQAKEHAEREKAYVKAKSRKKRQDQPRREDQVFRRES